MKRVDRFYKKVQNYIKQRKTLNDKGQMEKLFNIKEACEALKVSGTTLRKYIKSEVIKSIRIGGLIYIKESEINRVLSEGTN